MGGNHPTHIGDRMGPNGRYRIINKLGNGSYGIAWLVEDTKDRKKRWKSLKINDAGPGGESEVKLQKMFERLSYIGQKALDNQIVVPYEIFWVRSFNGAHLCTVLPILGPTLERIANDKRTEISRRTLCHQVILACHFLHTELEIMHGDFRCGNITLQIDGLQDLNEAKSWRCTAAGPRSSCLTTCPIWASTPRAHQSTLSSTLRMEKLTSLVKRKTGKKVVSNSRPKVAVADLGSSKHVSWTKPWDHVIPLSMTDPYCFFGVSAGLESDIFSMGVMLFELMAGGFMFKRGDKKMHKIWEDHFPYIEECVGPMPVEYRKMLLSNKHEISIHVFPCGIPADFHMSMNPSKTVVWPEERHEEARRKILGGMRAKNTVHGLLLYSEADRATISDIVKHKYFRAWSSTFKRDTGKGDRSCHVQYSKTIIPYYRPQVAQEIFHRVTFNRDVATGEIDLSKKASQYSTTGSASAFTPSVNPPEDEKLTTTRDCYIWDILETCDKIQKQFIANGTAITEDFIMRAGFGGGEGVGGGGGNVSVPISNAAAATSVAGGFFAVTTALLIVVSMILGFLF
ncbi:Protein kinase-like domain containing protein [Rhypophila decipiens]